MLSQLFLDLYQFALTHTFYLYFLPVVICLFGYSYRITQKYKQDTKNRDEYEKYLDDYKIYEVAVVTNPSLRPPRLVTYRPTVTVGTIIGSFIVSGLPVVNFGMALFWFLPTLAKDVINLCSDWFDIPLVPNRNTKR